ncbi:MAG: hypothetical protein KDJ86_15340 [Bauldia sp.]|uniref:hypothetical protein n=1 Tax=Bauldia sp. TaxID=2575872 RepID=UPI001DACE17D|nr:hypothetical protein [Bauldia sp.]MCB1497162.1 hypothetical protein [Bauldia sp.]
MPIQAPSRSVTLFRTRPRVLLFYFVLGLIFVVQGVATAGYFVIFDDGAGFQLIGIGLSLFLAVVGIVFAGYAALRIRDRHPPITIGPNGLHDRIISERPIPWEDIGDLRIWPGSRGGPAVVFDLAEGAEDRASVYRRARVEAEFNRAAGGYSYQIHPIGTDADVDRVVEAIRPFAQVRDT